MIPVAVTGELSVLNCGEGDIRVTLDPSNPVDLARGERIITDMLERGYMLFVDDGDGKLKRAVGFDATSKEYLIVDPFQPQVSSGVQHVDDDAKEPQATEAPTETGGTTQEQGKPGRKGKPLRRVSASKARATGVAPTAGG